MMVDLHSRYWLADVSRVRVRMLMMIVSVHRKQQGAAGRMGGPTRIARARSDQVHAASYRGEMLRYCMLCHVLTCVAVPLGQSRSRLTRATPHRWQGPPLSVSHRQNQACRLFVHAAQTADRPGGPAQRGRSGRSAARIEDRTERLSATSSEGAMLWGLWEYIAG